MPVHKVSGGWQWGNSGKVYSSRAAAVDQMQAAFANGYKDVKSSHKAAQSSAIQNLMKKHGSNHGK